MKKFTVPGLISALAAVFSLVCQAPAMAQDGATTKDGKVHLQAGVSAGSRLYSLKTDESASGSALHLSMEFEADWTAAGNLVLSAGASLAGSAGYHFAGDGSKNLGEIYLDIPLRAKYHFPFMDGRRSFFIFAGPVLSLDIVSLDAHSKGTTSNFDTFPDLGRFDLMLGGGVGLVTGPRSAVSLSYDHGLLDRDKGASASVHTSVVRLGINYRF